MATSKPISYNTSKEQQGEKKCATGRVCRDVALAKRANLNMNKREPIPAWLQVIGCVVAIAVPILMWVGGSVNAGYQYANTLATRSELAEAIKAIRELVAQTSDSDRKEMRDYSDTNRLKTLADTNTRLSEVSDRISAVSAEQRAQSVKVDMILQALQRMEEPRKGRAK